MRELLGTWLIEGLILGVFVQKSNPETVLTIFLKRRVDPGKKMAMFRDFRKAVTSLNCHVHFNVHTKVENKFKTRLTKQFDRVYLRSASREAAATDTMFVLRNEKNKVKKL
jgi:hypothetical protein